MYGITVETIRKNADFSEFELKEEDSYKSLMSFGDELEAIANGIAEVFKDAKITTSIYGFVNIKVRSKRDLDSYMGKLNELGRFTVQKRDLGSVIIYNINVRRNKYY